LTGVLEHGLKAYSGSKKLAEEAAWNFMRAHKNMNFTLATINPPMIYGPSFPGSIDLKHLGQSPGEIYALMNGSKKQVPPTAMPAFVDVRDVALAHLKAYETDQPGRFLVGSGKWSPQQVCDLFRENIPQIRDRVPVGNPGSAGPECYVLDTTRAQNVLGIKFRTFKETFLDMAKTFLEMENAEQEHSREKI
jgi:nucleoside-diphosphate-sugar epimerase